MSCSRRSSLRPGGGFYFSPEIVDMLREPAPRRPRTVPLSARELEVLRLVATGAENREIAERLFVSCETVKTPPGDDLPQARRGRPRARGRRGAAPGTARLGDATKSHKPERRRRSRSADQACDGVTHGGRRRTTASRPTARRRRLREVAHPPRVWSPLDAFLYNVMTTNVAVTFGIFLVAGAAFYFPVQHHDPGHPDQPAASACARRWCTPSSCRACRATGATTSFSAAGVGRWAALSSGHGHRGRRGPVDGDRRLVRLARRGGPVPACCSAGAPTMAP